MPDPRSFLPILSPDRLAMMQPPKAPSFFQQPGVAQGLIAGGLRLLASDKRRETFGQALYDAVPQGVAAYEQAKQGADWNTLLNDTGMPETQKAVLRMIGPERGALVLAEGMMQPGPALVALGANERLVDPRTGGTVVDAMPQTPQRAERPAELRMAIEMAGLDPDGEITPEQLPAVVDMYERMQKAGASSVNVGTGREITDLPATVQAQIVGAGPALIALDRYEEAAQAYLGRGRGDRIAGAVGLPDAERDQAIGELEAIQNTVLLQIKNLAELGVLNGPDMQIVTDMIGDPLSRGALIRDPSYTLTRITEARNFINDKLRSLRTNYELTETANNLSDDDIWTKLMEASGGP